MESQISKRIKHDIIVPTINIQFEICSNFFNFKASLVHTNIVKTNLAQI